MTPELREALRLAHERFEDDSDAFADEDLLRHLVEAVEDATEWDLRTDLLTTAKRAGRASVEATGPVETREWAEAAGRALQAYNIAPAREPVEMPADEREAVLEQVGQLRQAVERGRALAAFVGQLADEFERAHTETAGRVAARMRTALEEAGRL